MIPETPSDIINATINLLTGMITMRVVEELGLSQMIKIAELHRVMDIRRKRRDPKRYIMLKAKACCRGDYE